MQVKTFLHKLLDTSIHRSRILSLTVIVHGIIMTKELKLTKLGRGIEITGKERSGIRRVDRVLSNKYYQENSLALYHCITKLVIGSKTRPVILVDWSGIPNSHSRTKAGECCVLKATLATEGRGMTLYDEIHSKKKRRECKSTCEIFRQIKIDITH